MANGQRNRLTGLNPLAYCGVDPSSPPQLLIEDRAPTVNDIARYNIGTLWVTQNPQRIWMLVAIVANDAQWVPLYPAGASGAETFHTDVGDALSVANVINILGGENINTMGAGQDVTINLDDDVILPGNLSVAGTVEFLGLAAATVPEVLQIDNAGDVSSVSYPVATTITTVDNTLTNTFVAPNYDLKITNGTAVAQVLSYGTGGAPNWKLLESSDGSLNITALEGSPNGTIDFVLASPASTKSFMAWQAQDASPYLSDGTTPYMNLIGSIAHPLVVKFDTTGGFYPGDGAGSPATFTAPAAGNYQFTVSVHNGQLSGHSQIVDSGIWFITTTYIMGRDAAPQYTNFGGPGHNVETVILKLAQNDVVKFGSTWTAITSNPTALNGGGYTLYGSSNIFQYPGVPAYQTYITGIQL